MLFDNPLPKFHPFETYPIYNVVLYCIHYIVLYCTVLCCIVLCCIVLCCRFAQDLPLWQSALVKQSKQLSTTGVQSSVYPVANMTSLSPYNDHMVDPMTQTIRPHLIHQQLSSFKPIHGDGKS